MQEFQFDPTDGRLFLLLSRRRNRLSLCISPRGLWLYYKLLDAAMFEERKSSDDSSGLHIDTTRLSMLLSGVALVEANQRRKRYFIRAIAAG